MPGQRVIVSTDEVQLDRTVVRIYWVVAGWKLQRIIHINNVPRVRFDVVRFDIFYHTGFG